MCSNTEPLPGNFSVEHPDLNLAVSRDSIQIQIGNKTAVSACCVSSSRGCSIWKETKTPVGLQYIYPGAGFETEVQSSFVFLLEKIIFAQGWISNSVGAFDHIIRSSSSDCDYQVVDVEITISSNTSKTVHVLEKRISLHFWSPWRLARRSRDGIKDFRVATKLTLLWEQT